MITIVIYLQRILLKTANLIILPNYGLEGDHYKWRALRAHGIDEKYITGDASPKEKFAAWAKTVPYTLRKCIVSLDTYRIERTTLV